MPKAIPQSWNGGDFSSHLELSAILYSNKCTVSSNIPAPDILMKNLRF